MSSLNCTTNKPLHLGHFRNLALGAATAGTLEMLGARVVRHCILEDTGRFMSEAMAGVRHFERCGEHAANALGKPDHFVGSCYRRYRQGECAPAAPSADDAGEDEADALMRALLRGDEAARQLHVKVRSMALAGQQATLQRLGMWFDRCDYESSEDPALDDFIAMCSENGLFRRGKKGGLGYVASNGRGVWIVNPDGLAEEGARLLSFNWRLAQTGPANHAVVAMVGGEWKGAMYAYGEALRNLGAANGRDGLAHEHVFYGMVNQDGQKMASSSGYGVLIDHLLDELAGDARIVELSRRSPRDERPDELAAMVVKCFLLSVARTKVIDFSRERLGSDETSPGWAIAAAWGRLGGDDAAFTAHSRMARRICAAALSRVSFERAVASAGRLAGRILAGCASAADEDAFRTIVAALSLVPRRTEFRFERAGSLTELRAG